MFLYIVQLYISLINSKQPDPTTDNIDCVVTYAPTKFPFIMQDC